MSKIIKPDFVIEAESPVAIPDWEPPAAAPEPGGRPEDGGRPEPGGRPGPAPEAASLDYDLDLAKAQCEALISQASGEAAGIAAQAREEGFAAGYAEGAQQRAGEISQTLRELSDTLEQLRRDHEQFMARYQKELKGFSLEIASAILNRKLDFDPAAMTELVEKVIKTVKNADWISVTVSDALPQLAMILQKDLAGMAGLARLEIKTDHVEPGACIVETQDGLIDASVSTQLANLKQYFDMV